MSGTDDVASRLIASLEAEAEIIDRGEFTIDETKARDKLRDHQLADPDAWVLLLVELASLLGAKAIYFDYTEPERTAVHFRSAPFAHEQLAEPLSGVFASVDAELAASEHARRRAWQKLAIAINALLGPSRRVELIQVDAAGSGVRAIWSGDPQGRFALEPATLDPEFAGTHVRVMFDDADHVERERALLRRACRHSPLLVMAGAEKLSFGWKSVFESKRESTRDDEDPAMPATTPIRDADFRTIGVAACLPGRANARVRVQTNGVFAEDIELEGCRRGFVALVDLDLARDLSQSQVLRDAAFDRMLAIVRATHDTMTR